jgi:hypothetical protein
LKVNGNGGFAPRIFNFITGWRLSGQLAAPVALALEKQPAVPID